MPFHNTDTQSISVAINAQLHPESGAGGVASALAGLVYALGRLEGQDKYLIVADKENRDWLEQFISPSQQIIVSRTETVKPTPSSLIAASTPHRILASIYRPIIQKLREKLSPPVPTTVRIWPEVPVSDGFWESLNCDVVHFPYQDFTVCAVPSVYNPHDLQHLHYPQFFDTGTIAWRETVYPMGCHLAHAVIAGSQWVKDDIAFHYHVNSSKIYVVPWAPSTEAYPAPSPELLITVRDKYKLAVPYALYPAMTWQHKNHLRLLESMALLRDRDNLRIQLICTGYQYLPHWAVIKHKIHELRLEDQVQFVGFVGESELRAIYKLSHFVFVPTLFEAASGPVFEAWHHGIPVACSKVTSLPEQVGDAALLFNPYSIDSIADALAKMSVNNDLRDKLMHNGARRLQDFSWERTAKAYRAIYRKTAKLRLTHEDEELLSKNWSLHG